MAKRTMQKNHDVLVHPYEKASKKLRVLKFALIFVLIAFLLGGLLVLKDEFTAENLRFLLRDIGLSSPSLGLDASSLNFDYDTSLRADLYHGDLVLLKRSSLEVYSFSGSRSLNQNVAFSSPALVTGNKYMLAYDIGGTNLGIYNSFSELYTEEFEYKLFCADLADDGTFAVVTGEKGFHSALYVYNNEFERTFRYATADRVVYDVAVCREKPHLVALCAVRSENGDYLSEILLFDTTRAEVKKTWSFPSEMPLEIQFEKENALSFITDAGLHILNPNTDKNTTHAYAENDLALFFTQEQYAVLLKNSGIIGSTLTVDVIDTNNPSEKRSFDLNSQVLDVALGEHDLYLLSHDSLSVFSLSSGTLKTHKLQHEYKEILPLSGGRVAFVGEGSVSIYMVG
ncbi:MAG: hypothetical protein IKT43_02435 [Clostridia bacterium]|nr:hypothetical protein [Clostridia bacterium]